MATVGKAHDFRQIMVAIVQCVVLVLVIPVTVAFGFGVSAPATLALITSTVIIEYGAGAVGIGLGLNPVFIFFVLVSVALGLILGLFDLFDIIGEKSARVSRFLERSRTRANKSRLLADYGIYGLGALVIVLGIYFCAPISWLLGWPRKFSIGLILAGYMAASAVIILLSTGIVHLLTGGV